MLVNVSLLARLDQRGEGHRDWLEAHNAAIQRHDEAIKKHDEEMAELRAAQLKTEQSLQVMSAGLNALNETVDRFLRGQEGNGRKQ